MLEKLQITFLLVLNAKVREVVELSSIEKLFLHSKTVDVLLKILEAEENEVDTYPLSLSNEVNSPYSYVSRVLSEFEENAIIESKYKGRVRVVKLTEDGRKIAKKLKDLRTEMSKDFISRKKLTILTNFLKELQDRELQNKIDIDNKDGKNSGEYTSKYDCYIFAPLKVEIENILKNVKDGDKGAYEIAKRLHEEILNILSEKVCMNVLVKNLET